MPKAQAHSKSAHAVALGVYLVRNQPSAKPRVKPSMLDHSTAAGCCLHSKNNTIAIGHTHTHTHTRRPGHQQAPELLTFQPRFNHAIKLERARAPRSRLSADTRAHRPCPPRCCFPLLPTRSVTVKRLTTPAASTRVSSSWQGCRRRGERNSGFLAVPSSSVALS